MMMLSNIDEVRQYFEMCDFLTCTSDNYVTGSYSYQRYSSRHQLDIIMRNFVDPDFQECDISPIGPWGLSKPVT